MNVRRVAVAAVAVPVVWVAGWCMIAVNLEHVTRWQHRRRRPG